jgi:hypothetical protein
VELAYIGYDQETDRTTLLLALHFDFSVNEESNEPAAAHPLFHASLTHKLFGLGGELEKRKLDETPLARTAYNGLP